MKKYLLTWYGITDIRSAMGFEQQGPILGALKTKQFDEVHILAYTKKNFFSPDEIQTQQDAIRELREHASTLIGLSREESFHYVDILANTPSGHKFYRSWLLQQLDDAEIKVKVSMRECFLKELNDTEGIFFSAVKALRDVIDTAADITFFLSPGTPVMAFSWALAMMAFPNHRIKLLASPDYRKGVQTIELPESVLNLVANK